MYLTVHNRIPDEVKPLFWSYKSASIVEVVIGNHDNINAELATNTLTFYYNGAITSVQFPECFIYNLNDFIQLVNDHCGTYFTVTTEKSYTNKLIYKTTNDSDTIRFLNDNFAHILGMNGVEFTNVYANNHNIVLFPYRYYMIESEYFESNYRVNNHPCNIAIPIDDHLDVFKWTYNTTSVIKPALRVTGNDDTIKILVAMFDKTYTISSDFYITFYLSDRE